MTRRYLVSGLIAALVIGSAISAFGFGKRAGEMRDFEVYWTAANRAAAAEPLYRQSDEHYQFKYLPAFAVLARPLAWVSLETAKSAWFVLSVALIPALIALSVALLPARQRPSSLLSVVSIVAMAKFYGHELVLGQVNLLFGVLVAAALVLIARGSETRAALLIVAAVVVKPYAVLFVPWLLWVRPRTAAPLLLLAAVVVALPAATYGLQGTLALHVDWWRTATESTAPNLTNPDNVSLAAFFAKWLGVGDAAELAATGAAAVLLLVCAVVVIRGRGIAGGESLEGALLLMVIPLLSPQGWDYVFLIATPAVVVFANYAPALRPWLRALGWAALATIGLSIFDLLGRQRYATFMAWSVITVCFCVLVGALAAIRARRIA